MKIDRILFTLFLLFTNHCFSQIYQVEYQEQTLENKYYFDSGMTEEEEQKLLAKLNAPKEFILDANSRAWVYEPKNKKKWINLNLRSIYINLEAQDGKSYISLKDSTYERAEKFLRKRYRITHKLIPYKWTLLPDTATIGGFLCKKAEFVNPASSEIETVWYTPDIPLFAGPRKYWGLPGLILGVESSSTTYFATSVKTIEETDKIQPAQKGRIVGLAQFEKIRNGELDKIDQPDVRELMNDSDR